VSDDDPGRLKPGDLARTPFETNTVVRVVEIEAANRVYGPTVRIEFLEDFRGYPKGSLGRYPLRELQKVERPTIGPDGLCTCTCGDPCPLGKTGSALRCTAAELGEPA
jgi:hypothetical protein